MAKTKYYIDGKIVGDVCCKNKPYYTTSYTCFETQTISRSSSGTSTIQTTAYSSTTWLSRMSTYQRDTTVNSTNSGNYHCTFSVTQRRVKTFDDITISCDCECCCGCNHCDCVEPQSISGGYVQSRIFDRYTESETLETTTTKSSYYSNYESVSTTYSSTSTFDTEFNKSRIYSSTSLNPEDEKAISSTSDNKLVKTTISSIIGYNIETVTTGTSTTKTLYDTIYHDTDEYHSTTWQERVITGYESTPLTKTSIITYPDPVETVSVKTLLSKSFYTETKEILSKYWTTSSTLSDVWCSDILTSERVVEIEGEPATMTISYPKYL